jgi:hypothetical protein
VLLEHPVHVHPLAHVRVTVCFSYPLPTLVQLPVEALHVLHELQSVPTAGQVLSLVDTSEQSAK